MPTIDIPPQQQERIVCSITAAVKYDVPANIVLAVSEKEGGKPGQWVKNKNGTHDVGAMQFNTRYLNDLAKCGITPDDVAKTGCYPYDLAAWRLAIHIKEDRGDIWTRAANYHSRTYEYNKDYRADLMVKANKWADWQDAFMNGGAIDATESPKASTINRVREKTIAIAPERAQPESMAAQIQAVNMTYVPRKIIVSSD